MTANARRGAIVFRASDLVAYLPSHVAQKVVPLPKIARLAGAPENVLGIAWVEGVILPVVSVGPSRSVLLVCTYAEQPLGLVGLDVLAAGVFDAPRPDYVVHDGRRVMEFDLTWVDDFGVFPRPNAFRMSPREFGMSPRSSEIGPISPRSSRPAS